MNKRIVCIQIVCLWLLIGSLCGAEAVGTDPLAMHNVLWDLPSKDHNGSMPIGNGETAFIDFFERRKNCGN